MSLALAKMTVALATKKRNPTGNKFELKLIYFMRVFIYDFETNKNLPLWNIKFFSSFACNFEKQ